MKESKMKLVLVRATHDSITLGFRGPGCELVAATLRFGEDSSTDDVAAGLRDLAGNVETLEPRGLAIERAVSEMLAKPNWTGLLPRRGGKKTRSRSVAPASPKENPMANPKTAKKVAKKAVAKKAAAAAKKAK